MSAPLASNIAQQAGVVQTVAAPKTTRTKDAEQSRQAVYSDEGEEGSSKGPGVGSKSEGQAAQSTAATFGQQDKQKVKRKKVRVGTVSRKATGGTRRSEDTAETQQSGRSEARGRTGTGYTQEQSRSLVYRAMGSQASLTQASLKFEQAQRAQNGDAQNAANPLSAAGQRRMMLENLSRMVKISLEQHTGGQAGEAYPRRETRQIFSALLGLKNSASGGKEVERQEPVRDVSNGEFKLKEQKMNNVLAIFLDPTPPPEGHEPLELVA